MSDHYCCKLCGLRYDDCGCGKTTITPKVTTRALIDAAKSEEFAEARRDRSAAQRVVARILAWGPAGNLPNTVMPAAGVLLGVRAHGRSRHVSLSHLWVSPSLRGQRLGKHWVNRILVEAAAEGVVVRLRPHAFDRAKDSAGRSTGPNSTQLAAWYQREFGFRPASKAPSELHLLWTPPLLRK